MPVDEAARHALHSRLEQLLGETHAETLMAHLRAVGTGGLVTEAHLDQRLDLTEQRLELFEQRILTRLHAELGRQTRILVFSLLAANATFAGLVFAAVELV